MLITERIERILFHLDQNSIYGNTLFMLGVKQHGSVQNLCRRENRRWNVDL